MIYWEGETGKRRNDNAALEWRSFAVRTNDPVYDRIANPVLNLGLVDDRPVRICQKRLCK